MRLMKIIPAYTPANCTDCVVKPSGLQRRPDNQAQDRQTVPSVLSSQHAGVVTAKAKGWSDVPEEEDAGRDVDIGGMARGV